MFHVNVHKKLSPKVEQAGSAKLKTVKVINGQEMTQSEINSHSTLKQTRLVIRYLYKANIS